ncbi:JAB domain-containing protein [Bacteroidales bacterium OttesenSCG-928-B11]|nr:JAB domain-containing protein [Bacteroidales bacterium OttesenSCG-928-B11]
MEQLKTLGVDVVKIHYQTKTKPSERKKVTCSEDVYNMMMADEEMSFNIDYKELMFAIYLNQSNKVLSIMKISEGGITETTCDTRILMQGALLLNATNIIICHNHPGGEVLPSPSDISLTRRVKDAAHLLNIRLTDSIIISSEKYFSFVQENIL